MYFYLLSRLSVKYSSDFPSSFEALHVYEPSLNRLTRRILNTPSMAATSAEYLLVTGYPYLNHSILGLPEVELALHVTEMSLPVTAYTVEHTSTDNWLGVLSRNVFLTQIMDGPAKQIITKCRFTFCGDPIVIVITGFLLLFLLLFAFLFLIVAISFPQDRSYAFCCPTRSCP